MIDAHHLLADFGRYLGIADLGFDQESLCVLKFDDTVVELESQPERHEILLMSEIGTIPDQSSAGIFSHLLGANSASAKIGGGTLGLDEESGRVYWFDRIATRGLKQEEFQDSLLISIKRVEYWRDEFERGTFGVQGPFTSAVSADPIATEHYLRV